MSDKVVLVIFILLQKRRYWKLNRSVSLKSIFITCKPCLKPYSCYGPVEIEKPNETFQGWRRTYGGFILVLMC